MCSLATLSSKEDFTRTGIRTQTKINAANYTDGKQGNRKLALDHKSGEEGSPVKYDKHTHVHAREQYHTSFHETKTIQRKTTTSSDHWVRFNNFGSHGPQDNQHDVTQ